MSNGAYIFDITEKISLLPSWQAIKRIGLVLAVSLRVAGVADFGYGTLTTGHHLETTDDVDRDFRAALGRANADGAAAPILNTAAAVRLEPHSILSSLPPGPVPQPPAFALARRNASATTQRSLFLQGTLQPGDLPWTRTF